MHRSLQCFHESGIMAEHLYCFMYILLVFLINTKNLLTGQKMPILYCNCKIWQDCICHIQAKTKSVNFHSWLCKWDELKVYQAPAAVCMQCIDMFVLLCFITCQRLSYLLLKVWKHFDYWCPSHDAVIICWYSLYL